MESPSEWAKRYNRQVREDEKNPQTSNAGTAGSPAAGAEFPSDPFACPACGQLLGPECRVCVACHHAIDPAEIIRPKAVVLPAAPAPVQEVRPRRVRYPWSIFFAVLGASFLIAMFFGAFMGEQKAQLAMGGVQTAAGIWVVIDAHRRGIPRPLRWGLGTIILPVFIFPWYLARRTEPQSPVPFVEAEVGVVTRIILFAIIAFFLLSFIMYIVQGPPPGNNDIYRILKQK